MKQTLALVLLLCSLTLLTGCPVPNNPETPVSQWLVTDPVTGAGYYLYVPQSYSHTKPAPVIFTCHGTPPFDIAEHHIRTWKYYGEKHGCIIVAPVLDGTDGILGDGPVIGMINNEIRMFSILSTLSYQYNIDRANIMITGFSGGGFPAYWVGLRHPDVFTVIVAQNCNFSRSNTDGWYPPEAVRTPVMVYYGQNDPATIQVQSLDAIQYLREHGFKVETAVIPNAGHDRHPEVAMKFFLDHMKPARGTMQSGSARPIPLRVSATPAAPQQIDGPRIADTPRLGSRDYPTP